MAALRGGQTESDAAELAGLAERLAEDLSDLAMMYSSVIEHSTELENELSRKNETISALIDKMRRYLPEQLFERIVGGSLQTRTGSQHRRMLTVFFSDVVGFTELTDTLEAETLTQLLNSYLNSMARICARWGGVIDKFIGDAVMIFFGDEEEADPVQAARNCVAMALEMQSSLGGLQEEWQRLGVSHRLKIRVGINSGYCTIGNFGSDERMDYTIIGGSVNIASRLEHLCPPGGICLSGSTYGMVRDLVEVKPLGRIQVKGVAHPVETYEVIGRRPELLEQTNPMLAEHAEGFDLRSICFDRKLTSRLELEAMRESLKRALERLDSSAAEISPAPE